MLQHFAYVFYFTYVLFSELLEFCHVFGDEIFICFYLQVVLLCLVAILAFLILRKRFYVHVSFRNFFHKLFSAERLRVYFKELAALYLVNAVPLIGVLRQCLFYQFSECVWRWNVFENLPIVLLHCTRQSLVVWVRGHSFPKGRRLHIHHEQSSSTGKDVCFFTVILWKHSQLSHLAIDLCVINVFFVLLLLLIYHFLLSLLERYLVIPNFRRVVNLRSNVIFQLNVWVKFLAEKAAAINLIQSLSKAKVRNQYPSFFIDKQIFRLNISVHYSYTVEVFDSFYKLI